jgi:hypothetical protein
MIPPLAPMNEPPCPNCDAPVFGPWCAECGQHLDAGPGALGPSTRRQWARNYTAQTSAAGAALLGAIVLWQWGYVVVAFRRVYADRAWSAALKSAAMVVATFFVNNAVVLVSFWVALATASIAT